MPVSGVHHVQLSQQQVDEHGNGQEGASHGGVAAQEEEEVAEEAEEDHPDHVQLKEQVEGVETSGHCAQVLDKRRKAQHPEEATQQADNQELPHLLQALLSCGQQAAMRKLLEELLAA